MSIERARIVGSLQALDAAHVERVATIIERAGVDPIAFDVKAAEIDSRIFAVVPVGALWAIAERTGRVLPAESTEIRRGDDGFPVAATAGVRVLVAGTWHTVMATAVAMDYGVFRDGPLVEIAQAIAIRSVLAIECAGLIIAAEIAAHRLAAQLRDVEREATNKLHDRAPARTDGRDRPRRRRPPIGADAS